MLEYADSEPCWMSVLVWGEGLEVEIVLDIALECIFEEATTTVIQGKTLNGHTGAMSSTVLYRT